MKGLRTESGGFLGFSSKHSAEQRIFLTICQMWKFFGLFSEKDSPLAKILVIYPTVKKFGNSSENRSRLWCFLQIYRMESNDDRGMGKEEIVAVQRRHAEVLKKNRNFLRLEAIYGFHFIKPQIRKRTYGNEATWWCFFIFWKIVRTLFKKVQINCIG